MSATDTSIRDQTSVNQLALSTSGSDASDDEDDDILGLLADDISSL